MNKYVLHEKFEYWKGIAEYDLGIAAMSLSLAFEPILKLTANNVSGASIKIHKQENNNFLKSYIR
ncbi:hypothetical protein HUG20_16280 [Salicibibacter cibi]|uniref:Uncharacterized protein n=1 Tax=Salicibibacter cibi TaxID=2743001 RepID=A0A7T6ZDL6_9BACI|nr:hypothetical protein [Salicibibacter cibi]QQK81312.1 hypothetical protein HUG20_16280 [Salicibibacter cibi]